jgi:hypothetical protein
MKGTLNNCKCRLRKAKDQYNKAPLKWSRVILEMEIKIAKMELSFPY